MAAFSPRMIERPPVLRRSGSAASRDAERAPRPGRDPAQRQAPAAEDSISRSVRAVERAVENFAALRQSCDYFKGLAVELRDACDEEKEQARAFAQQLSEVERSRRTDRDRAERAEQRLERAAETIRELERQLATANAQTDRLVHTISRLMSAEKHRGGREIDLADLLAA